MYFVVITVYYTNLWLDVDIQRDTNRVELRHCFGKQKKNTLKQTSRLFNTQKQQQKRVILSGDFLNRAFTWDKS